MEFEKGKPTPLIKILLARLIHGQLTGITPPFFLTACFVQFQPWFPFSAEVTILQPSNNFSAEHKQTIPHIVS